MRARRESLCAGLCHLCNALLLWGLLFCGWMWYALREESRYVVRHARQAMVFHTLMMATLLVYILIELVVEVLRVLSPALGTGLHRVNTVLFVAVLVAYWSVCLFGAWRCLRGHDFHYPLLRGGAR